MYEQCWHGLPILLGHPRPQRIEIGTVLNVRANGIRLVGEAYFDIHAANNADPRIIPAVSSGTKLEVSCGFCSIQRVKSGGICHGRGYVAVARRCKPDHLALLLDKKGACTVEDGCGINN
jgi:hypothetical protein